MADWDKMCLVQIFNNLVHSSKRAAMSSHSQEFLDHDTVDYALDQINTDLRASEVHGLLCGLLCVLGTLDLERWYGEIFEDAGDDEADKSCRELLQQLHLRTLEQLDDADLGFRLLLPEDDVDIEDRVDELGGWCQGFLYGLGSAGLGDEGGLDEEMSEFLADLGQIAQIGYDAEDEEAETNESSIVELIEYVRMGVITLIDTMQPVLAHSTHLH